MALLVQRSVDPAVIGVIFAVTNLIQMAMEIPSGVLADRFGQRLSTVLGSAFWGVGLMLFALTTELPWNVVGLCVWAVGMALFSGAPIALAVNHAKSLGLESEVPRLVRLTHVWRWVASAAGAMLSISLIGKMSPQALIAVGGVALIAAALIIHISWPEYRSDGHGSASRTTVVATVASAWSKHRNLLITTCLLFAPFTLMILSWQPAAQQLGGVAIEALPVPLLFLSLAAALGAYLLKHIPQLVSEVAVLAAAVGIAGCVAAASIVDGWPVIAWYVAAELFAGIALAGVATLQHNAFSDAGRSTLSSVFSAATALLSATISLGFGWLWQIFGIAGALVLAGSLLAAVVVLYGSFLAIRKGRQRTKSSV